MLARGNRLALVVAAGVMFGWAQPVAAQESASAPAAAPASVLVTPVQGSAGLQVGLADRVLAAVHRALLARGYRETATQGLLGQAVVACQTPECIEQALDAAGATFAIVPAIWSRDGGGEELTLTLVPRSGRSLNANGAAGEDLVAVVNRLVDELFAKQAAAGAVSAGATSAGTASAAAAAPGATSAASARGEVDMARRPHRSEPRHPHAWKAGPIVLIAAGAGAFIAVGVGAAVQSDSQQLNAAAVAAWSALGAAALAGGIAWWVVGEKRHRERRESTQARAPAIRLRPTGIDLRLRF